MGNLTSQHLSRYYQIYHETEITFNSQIIVASGLVTAGAVSSAKRVLLKLTRCELRDDTVLDGSVVRVEDVEGHSDLVALSIQFSSDPPISYKQKINSFFAGSQSAG